ncbi:GSCOCG00005576001-RA-CDS, partial [Cotesia congregata]
IYCGNNKSTDVEQYLAKFIEEINRLQETGIIISNRFFNISIKAFICDRPARSLLKSMKNHGGYYASERCTVSGMRHKKRTIYPLLNDSEPRTNESFRNQSNPENHTGKSPLHVNEHEIDLVQQFVLDSMHLLFLGVMKKLLGRWFSTEFQFLLLYAGPVVFKKILPATIYKHFLLSHIAYRIYIVF